MKNLFLLIFNLAFQAEFAATKKMPRGLTMKEISKNPNLTPKMVRFLKKIKPMLSDPEARDKLLKGLKIVKEVKNSAKRRR